MQSTALQCIINTCQNANFHIRHNSTSSDLCTTNISYCLMFFICLINGRLNLQGFDNSKNNNLFGTILIKQAKMFAVIYDKQAFSTALQRSYLSYPFCIAFLFLMIGTEKLIGWLLKWVIYPLMETIFEITIDMDNYYCWILHIIISICIAIAIEFIVLYRIRRGFPTNCFICCCFFVYLCAVFWCGYNIFLDFIIDNFVFPFFNFCLTFLCEPIFVYAFMNRYGMTWYDYCDYIYAQIDIFCFLNSPVIFEDLLQDGWVEFCIKFIITGYMCNIVLFSYRFQNEKKKLNYDEIFDLMILSTCEMLSHYAVGLLDINITKFQQNHKSRSSESKRRHKHIRLSSRETGNLIYFCGSLISIEIEYIYIHGVSSWKETNDHDYITLILGYLVWLTNREEFRKYTENSCNFAQMSDLLPLTDSIVKVSQLQSQLKQDLPLKYNLLRVSLNVLSIQYVSTNFGDQLVCERNYPWLQYIIGQALKLVDINYLNDENSDYNISHQQREILLKSLVVLFGSIKDPRETAAILINQDILDSFVQVFTVPVRDKTGSLILVTSKLLQLFLHSILEKYHLIKSTTVIYVDNGHGAKNSTMHKNLQKLQNNCKIESFENKILEDLTNHPLLKALSIRYCIKKLQLCKMLRYRNILRKRNYGNMSNTISLVDIEKRKEEQEKEINFVQILVSIEQNEMKYAFEANKLVYLMLKVQQRTSLETNGQIFPISTNSIWSQYPLLWNVALTNAVMVSVRFEIGNGKMANIFINRVLDLIQWMYEHQEYIFAHYRDRCNSKMLTMSTIYDVYLENQPPIMVVVRSCVNIWECFQLQAIGNLDVKKMILQKQEFDHTAKHEIDINNQFTTNTIKSLITMSKVCINWISVASNEFDITQIELDNQVVLVDLLVRVIEVMISLYIKIESNREQYLNIKPNSNSNNLGCDPMINRWVTLNNVESIVNKLCFAIASKRIFNKDTHTDNTDTAQVWIVAGIFYMYCSFKFDMAEQCFLQSLNQRAQNMSNINLAACKHLVLLYGASCKNETIFESNVNKLDLHELTSVLRQQFPYFQTRDGTVFKHLAMELIFKNMIDENTENDLLQIFGNKGAVNVMSNIIGRKQCCWCRKKCTKLRRCKCKMAYYCSKKCQKKHWIMSVYDNAPHRLECSA